MKILNLIQGSPEWKAHRAHRFNASDAPAMLGESPHMTREQLLRRMKSGIAPEVDAATQRRFDDGHAVEVLLRKVAEDKLEEPLYPFVGVPDDEQSLLSASFDGSTFVGDTTAECKLLNARLRAAFTDMETIAPAHRERAAAQCLPIDYRIQMEQQLRVAQAERVLFLAGELRDNGTLGDVFSCWYYPDDKLWARIEGGWPVFAENLAAYEAPASTVAAVAAPIESLPAVVMRMDGALKVIDNLDVFGLALREFVAKIPKQPSTDDEFATCEAACKALKKAEESLAAGESAALASMADVEKMRRVVADLQALARETRLAREKDVKRRKEEIKGEQVARGCAEFAKHIEGLNARIGKPYMPTIPTDFPGAIASLKKFDSLRAAIDQHVADKKIEANSVADRIGMNLNWLRDHAEAFQFLFSDVAALVLKDHDYLVLEARRRIDAHQAEEARKEEATRERIRAEEAAKLQREREAEEKRAREAQEALERQHAAMRAAGEFPTYGEAVEAATAGVLLQVRRFPHDPWANRRLGEEMNAHCYYRRAPQEVVPAPSPAPATVAAPAPASQAANVVPMGTRAPAPQAAPTLRLGSINERIAPLSITEAGLARLGFPAITKERSACLYNEADFGRMVDSMVASLRTAQQVQQAA